MQEEPSHPQEKTSFFLPSSYLPIPLPPAMPRSTHQLLHRSPGPATTTLQFMYEMAAQEEQRICRAPLSIDLHGSRLPSNL